MSQLATPETVIIRLCRGVAGNAPFHPWASPIMQALVRELRGRLLALPERLAAPPPSPAKKKRGAGTRKR